MYVDHTSIQGRFAKLLSASAIRPEAFLKKARKIICWLYPLEEFCICVAKHGVQIAIIQIVSCCNGAVLQCCQAYLDLSHKHSAMLKPVVHLLCSY
jgi:hypothetical protein